MSKFKKQMVSVAVLLAAAVLLCVGYFIFKEEETVKNPAPEITGEVVDGRLVVSGLDKTRTYVYSQDGGKTYKELEEGITEFTAEKGKICFVKEKDDRSEVASVGGYGEPTKDGRPYLFEPVDKLDIDSIFVHNTLDEYNHIRKKSGAYKIEGLEGYEVNEQMMVFLRAYTLDVLALRYVDASENLSDYGIDKENPEVYFVVTANDGNDVYKVIIGDKTPSGDGYYAMLDGRDALYVIGTGIETSVLKSRHAYVTPSIVRKVEETHIYNLRSFTLNKNGKRFISIETVKGDLTYGNNATHRITYPAYNYATSFTNFDLFLKAINSLQGVETLLYGEEVNEEALREYGFFDENGNDVSDYSFSYSYPVFSESLFVKTIDDGYAVYSENAKLVVRVPKESLAFLEWDMLLWVSSEIYLLDIENIASITFEANGDRAEFVLSGELDGLTVHGNSKIVNIDEFKELYRSILYVIVTSYSEESSYGGEVLRMTVVTEKGETLDYRFFAHSSQNSYYTLNGFGEFYVSAEKINAIKDSAFGLIY